MDRPPSSPSLLSRDHPAARWRLLFTPSASGAENMALDEALMHRALATDEWVLRVYTWSAPTLSLGRNQTARGGYDLDRLREDGVGVVRRPTGGRAILHHREITYSVTAPARDAGDLRASYDRINRVLLHAMHRLGVPARLAPAPGRTSAPISDPANPGAAVPMDEARSERRHPAPGLAPCFAEPAAGELTVNGAKLAGSAQWRSDGALLQHGSILVADDQSRLARYVLGASRAVPAPATLSALLGHTPPPRDVFESLADAVTALEDPRAEPLELEAEIRARASALVVRYLNDDWTWRR